LAVSADVSSQYVAMMNAIFSAQKLAVPVDSCVLAERDSLFLQQAAHLTNGVYYKPPAVLGLLQHLLMTFLPDANSRRHLILPQSAHVDYRASCFCHHRLIELGRVCPVCLSIFCEDKKNWIRCDTCGTRFAATLGATRPRAQIGDPLSHRQPSPSLLDELGEANGDVQRKALVV